jgi:ABC-type transport system involved in cytochrome bd biosynthesis fused ATPase/permease subunit
LQNKIRVLVTHQCHFLTNVGKIIILNNGEITFTGNYNDLLKSGIDINKMKQTDSETSIDNVKIESMLNRTLSNISKNSRINEHEIETFDKEKVILFF